MTQKIILSLIFIISLSSCTKEQTVASEDLSNEPVSITATEKWQLVRMTGSMPNSGRTGAAMAWQEFYLLNPDKTFVKSREQSGTTSNANGTYKFITLSEQQYVALTYSSKNPLIGNCTGELKEYLLIESEDKMSGTWNICDGPGLEYKKIL